MKTIKPDTLDQSKEKNTVSVFLGGTIEMGMSEDWQIKIEELYKGEPVTFYNPRRNFWDHDFKMSQTDSSFNQQVNWELNSLESADVIFMNFLPNTKSPISLLEFGLFANTGKMVVCCPEGFWRKGNIEVVCTRYSIPLFNDIEGALWGLRTKIKQNLPKYEQ